LNIHYIFCRVFILKVGKIVKHGWISTRSKLEDPMTYQLIDFRVWNHCHEQWCVILFLFFFQNTSLYYGASRLSLVYTWLHYIIT